MIAVEGLAKTLIGPAHELAILRDVDLTVAAGEIVLIRGRSGSGKSTLLFTLGLLDRPTAGTYELDGIETTTLGDKAFDRLRASHIGYLFQNFYLMPRLTAWENVVLPLDHASTDDRRAGTAWANELVELLQIGHRLHHVPSQMSGGEQQRVGLARALVRRPRLLLADEPTGSLDEATGASIAQLMTQVTHELGITAVVASHDTNLFGPLADREFAVADGTVRELAGRP